MCRDQPNSRLHGRGTNRVIETLSCNWRISVKSRENYVFGYLIQFLANLMQILSNSVTHLVIPNLFHLVRLFCNVLMVSCMRLRQLVYLHFTYLLLTTIYHDVTS